MEQIGPRGKKQLQRVVYNKNMNKKRLTIIIVALFLFALTIFFLNKKNKDEKNESVQRFTPSPLPTTELPKSSFNFQKPEGFKINISGLEVNNFYNFDTEVNERGDVTFVKNALYQILYFSEEDEFLISVLSSPFEQARSRAELDFLNKLEINKNQACQLKVNISTPNFVNPNESGKNYKLSFCQ